MSSAPASGSNGAASSKKQRRREEEEDDEDGGAPGSSDEEGIDLMNSDGDSSEEDDDDDAEEEARIREGFIADEDEDDGARERRKRRKHKKKKNKEREFEALSEDDLDLVEQNTGVRIERPEGRKLKKLKRAGAASDDEDADDSGDGRAPDIANLFDDISSRARKDKGKRRAQERDAADDDEGDGLGADLMEEDDMADFIEEDSPDEDGTGEVRDREARLARKQKERERRKKQKGGFSIGGLDMSAEAWGEIQEVFGDGHDYDDALESDEEDGKPAPRMQDVFEPSEIAERMMTDADDIIRATDIPERMQIAQTGISTHRTPPPPTILEGEEAPAEPESSDLLLFRSELGDAANWISTRISDDLTREYILTPDGHIPELRGVFVTAVQRVLQFLCEQCFEVPFIWMHRRDYFIHHDPTASNATNRERTLLDRDDLWKIYHLAIKYRAMLDRKANLLKLWSKLGIEEDEHFTDTFAQIESLEEAADLVEYVMVKHQRKLKQLAQAAGANIIGEDQDADAVRTASDGSKYKRATSGSRYEKAKDSMVARFAEQIAVPAEALAAGFEAGSKQAHIEDPPSAPEDFAQQFTDVTSLFADYDQVINAAKVILVHEISKEPILKKGVRTAFRTFGAVSVKPTEKGAQKIDETHSYNAFKYLLDKPVDHFLQSTQFLQILDAESEGLVTVDIHIMKEPLRKLTQDFYTAYLSESMSEVGRAWNKVREDIIVEALQYHLLPMAARWTKDWLKETEEDWLAARCARALENRINQAPYDRHTQPIWPSTDVKSVDNVPVHPNPQTSDPKKNIPPKVMAISSGNGDRQRDWVETVVLAPKGRFAGREKYKEVRYRDSKHQLRLQVLRTRPDVVVVGGFTANTHELKLDVQAALQLHDKEIQDRLDAKLLELRSINRDVQKLEEFDIKDALTEEQYQQMVTENWVHYLPVVFVNDEVARLYQNSERAQLDFAELSPVERYCVGLARHVQDPLCEYAALGNDITALSFDPDQRLISREKLLPILESAIVNIVNITGVDINKAIREPNYRVLLPYVSGLGPRKASGMVRRITAASEGTLICRADLVKKEICTSRIFMNCVAFLRIPPENMDDEDDYDILDSTRIHSEDYHIARKMAGDAEEMDEEDLEDLPHPSAIVAQLMADDPQKLNELSLDDFAAALFETQQLQKRLTLYMIRDELQRPYSDRREVYRTKTQEDAFMMLTGETTRSLDLHLVVPMVVTRIVKDETIEGRLDSGVKAVAVPPQVPVPQPFRVGQTIQAYITNLDINSFKVDVSLLPEHIAAANDTFLRKVQPDQFYDNIQASMDKQADEARNKRSQGRHRRVVNHPNFYNFNAGQAEQHLANLQRGDCVVRPSSRGTDHLAVTWKVDDGVYQHIDVLELDKQNEFSLGKSLRVQGKYTYSDLDELIVSYVRSMARKVDEMMHSDKYKGTEADLRKWLNTSIMAEPARSFYGFALDPRKPGNFILAFLTKGYEIQSWSISVEPEQFLLQGNSDPAPNVTMLCNAFKSMYMTRQAMLAGAGGGGGGPALGGRTPHLGGRTPNPAAGGRTPAQSGTTPYGSRSPYVHRGAPPPQAHQMRPQTPLYMAQQQQQYQPPPPGPPAQPSGGAFMHPSRMQQAGFGR